MISKYNDFIFEKEFNNIIEDIFRVVESSGWVDKNKYEWDLTKDKNDDFKFDIKSLNSDAMLEKLHNFLNKIPKDKIKHYFIKIMNTIKNLPPKIRRNLIIGITGVFLTFVGIEYLTGSSDIEYGKIAITHDIPKENNKLSPTVTKEIINLNKKSSFKEAQKLVKISEAGFSDDRGDAGNWIKTRRGKKIFVGTNHGISAPVLAEYLGRTPSKKDMMNLNYATAVKIYKNNYWNKQNLSRFCNQSVANIIYDGCVNQGVEGMKDVVEKALSENGIKTTDNVFSIKNIKKANTLDQSKLFESIKKYRSERYYNAPTFKRHGEGWLNRLDSLEFND